MTVNRSTWTSYIILLIGIFVTLEAANFVVIVTPTMTAYYGIDTKNASIFSIAYYVTGIALAPLFGRLGDRVGRKHLVLIGLVIFSISEFVATAMPPLSVMIIARVVQGLGYAFIFANVLAYIPEMFNEENRGKAVGLFTLFTYVATGTGGLIAGSLLDSFGWNAIYFVSGSLAAIGAVLVFFFVPTTKPLSKSTAKIDVKGAFVIMLFIGAFVSIPLMASNFGYDSVNTLILGVIALLFLVVVIFVEKHAQAPILDVTVLKIRGIGASSILITGTHLLLMATVNVLTFFAASRAGITGIALGFIPTVNFAMGILVGPIVGFYLDKFRPFYLIIAALTSGSIGIVLFSMINANTTIGYLLIIVAFMGAFGSSLNTALIKIVVDDSPKDKQGVGTGTFAFFKDFGFPLGSSIGLAVYGVSKSSGSTSAVEEIVRNAGGSATDVSLISNAIVINQQTAEVTNVLNSLGLKWSALLTQADVEGINSAINSVTFLNSGVLILLFIITFIMLKNRPFKKPILDSKGVNVSVILEK